MKFKNIFLLLFMAASTASVSAQKYISKQQAEVSKTWGEQTFTSQKSFYDNIADAPDFSILAEILKNDARRQKLENQEMVTIFAVADEAFLKLPKKRRDSILGNANVVNTMINYLAVPGRLDSYSLSAAVKKNGGKAYLNTLDGHRLEVTDEAGELLLVDENGNRARILAPDFYHKNGFFHIIDGLIFPPAE